MPVIRWWFFGFITVTINKIKHPPNMTSTIKITSKKNLQKHSGDYKFPESEVYHEVLVMLEKIIHVTTHWLLGGT